MWRLNEMSIQQVNGSDKGRLCTFRIMVSISNLQCWYITIQYTFIKHGIILGRQINKIKYDHNIFGIYKNE